MGESEEEISRLGDEEKRTWRDAMEQKPHQSLAHSPPPAHQNLQIRLLDVPGREQQSITIYK